MKTMEINLDEKKVLVIKILKEDVLLYPVETANFVKDILESEYGKINIDFINMEISFEPTEDNAQVFHADFINSIADNEIVIEISLLSFCAVVE